MTKICTSLVLFLYKTTAPLVACEVFSATMKIASIYGPGVGRWKGEQKMKYKLEK